MADAALDVLAGVRDVAHAQHRGRRRHQLHQAPRPRAGDRMRVERRLDPDDGLDQPLRDAVAGRRLSDFRRISRGLERGKVQPPCRRPRHAGHPSVTRVIGGVGEVDGSVRCLQAESRRGGRID